MAKSSGNYGLSGLNKSQNPQLSNSKLSLTGNSKGKVKSARVISVVLDSSHPRFTELGGWAALGAIEYDIALNPKYNKQKYPVAYPLNTNIKFFPLKHETVNLLSAFDTGIDLFENKQPIFGSIAKTYYMSPINLWNTSHHNGYSFSIVDPAFTQNKPYDQTQSGSYASNPDYLKELNLGRTFIERGNIHPLQPFEGDIIYEGRWDNSIRFGSTVKNTNNNWSRFGTNGDPILIIRNGQGIQDNNAEIPVVENINSDESSIYLTSTQSVPLAASSTSYVSYKNSTPPAGPGQYSGNQILINSGRLIFNSKTDHILLSSAKSINLNSKNSVNIDTTSLSVQANNIYLGRDGAEEPLLLGNKTVEKLMSLIESLSAFMTVALTAKADPSMSLPTINSAAADVLGDLNRLKTSLKDITSKRNFTV